MSAVGEQIDVDLASLVREHQADVWRYLRYLGASANDADDLTQETFLAMSRAAFIERSPPETAAYLRTVARNQLLQARRRAGREIDTVELTVAEQVWKANVSGGFDDYLAALNDCLEKLEGRAREVVEQFYRQARSRQEIAEQMKMKPDGVKSLLRRTRGVLRQCIEQHTRETKKESVN